MAWPVRNLFIMISLPIFAICAWTLYHYHVKDKEWERYLRSINKHEIEINVPIDAVGTLIGRGGENIKEIQERTQTIIKFKNSGNENVSYKICRVIGLKENVECAKTLILEVLNPKDVDTLEVWVPQYACGRIIGRCGDSIRSIMRTSKASIRVHREDTRQKSTEKVLIKIKGNSDAIAHAKKLVEEKVREAERNKPKSPRLRTKKQTGKGAVQNVTPQYESLTATTVDDLITVYVSSVSSPHHFWLQLVSPRAVELDQMVEEMTEYYSKAENQTLHKLKEVKKGQIVASKFEKDGKWYRAEVFSFNKNEKNSDESQVDIFYVDYGDSSFMPLCELLELKPEYLHLKFQAIEACMKGVLPKGEKWDEDAIDAFCDMVHSAQWKELLVKVICYKEVDGSTRKEPIPIVKLYEPLGPQGVDIGSKFIEEGFAHLDETDEPDTKEYDVDDDEIWDP